MVLGWKIGESFASGYHSDMWQQLGSKRRKVTLKGIVSFAIMKSMIISPE